MRVIKGQIVRCCVCKCYIEYDNDDLEIVQADLTEKQKEFIEEYSKDSIFRRITPPTFRYLKCPCCSYTMQV